jgi:hypothetical protein
VTHLLIWLAPAALAVLASAWPRPPSAWFERVLHFFGINSVDPRRTLVALLAFFAAFGAAADMALELWAPVIATHWRQLDAAAIGLGAALLLLAIIAKATAPVAGAAVEAEPEKRERLEE